MDPQMLRALTGTAEAPELTFRRRYRADPDQVLDACTNIERLARWFGTVEGEPRAVGDSFTAALSEDPLDRAEGRVLACDNESVAVAWSWQGEAESVITARVRPLGGGITELTLHHALAEVAHAAGYGGGWEQTLQALARALGAADPQARSDEDIEREAVQVWRTILRAPLELEQRIEAPIDRVWAAFTTEDGLASWWWRHWDDVAIDLDLRVGGGQRFVVPSQQIDLRCDFVAIDAPHHLAYTWQWSDTDGRAADEAVDIRLRQDGGATVVLVRHSGAWADDAPAENYREGWTFVLSELAAVLQR